MPTESIQTIVTELEAEWLAASAASAGLADTGLPAPPYDLDEIGKDDPEDAAALSLVPPPAKHPVVVAEGDSWFDYPLKGDLLDALRKKHGYKIHQVSKAGALLEDMVYGSERRFWGGSKPQIITTMELVAKVKPSLVLFSGGGNDIAGQELAAFVNRKAPGVSPLREEAMDNLIHVVFRRAYEVFIEAMKTVAKKGNFKLQVLSHGYDFVYPDGRGYSISGLIPGFSYVGPWLKPTFSSKGYSEDEGREIIKDILIKFRKLQSDVEAAHPGVFHTVNLQGSLIPTDKTHWDNEMHPTWNGFKIVASKVHSKIQSL